MPKRSIRVAIIGVGNVASALVQSIYSRKVEGIWHQRIGGFDRKDVEIVAAFDVDKMKVGKDLSEAIFAAPNVGPRFSDIKRTGITVQPGIVHEDIPKHIGPDRMGSEDFEALLKESKADVALLLIPSGMQETAEAYAAASLRAKCSFINATPATIATSKAIRTKFASSKLVVVGDDLMSQFGGTAFHKGILDFINSRGLKVEKSYQLDVGGGNETLNTINERVKMEKRDIKTESIAEEIPYKFQTVAGTTDYVDYMGNNRTSYFWISAKSFFDSDVKIDVYLRTNDGANAGNVILDIVRAVAKSKQAGKYGAPNEICDYGFKKLPKPVLLHEAHREFLNKYAK
ncbi:MAG: L-myo-inositol-1-phosphate synthase [Thaumarchaeota archaeon]|nr:L-myo-inositol-1-phosphate synthase [Nitrososphaerota archaeon]